MVELNVVIGVVWGSAHHVDVDRLLNFKNKLTININNIKIWQKQ
jgi:hypothetical protein